MAPLIIKMVKKAGRVSFFLLSILFMLNLSVKGQNLVENGSFEDIYRCPELHGLDESTLNVVKGNWIRAFIHMSVIYPHFPGRLFHACADNIYNMPNTGHGLRYARTGKGMASQRFYSLFGGYWAWIQTMLSDTLEAGREYCFSYHVLKGPTQPYHCLCIQEFMASFSCDTIKHQDFSSTAPLSSLWPSQYVVHRGGIIKDTVNWTRISGSIIANGDEAYFTISSHIYHDSITSWTGYGGIDTSSWPGNAPECRIATYFVDDVAVWDCSAPVYKADAGPDQKVCAGDEVTPGTHDLEEYQYYWFAEGNLQDTLSTVARPTFKVEQTTNYVLKVIDFKFDRSWDTVRVIVEDCIIFDHIPNVFTPDGDGINDYFDPVPPDNVEFTVEIYNRWGKRVYRGDQNHPWDGTINGQKAAQGVYYYVLHAVHTLSGSRQRFTGSVTVLY